MISGEDILIDVSNVDPAAALDAVVRCVYRHWPDMIVQDGATGNRLHSYASIPFGRLPELLIYRNEEFLRSWAQTGASSANANAMVHVLADAHCLTLVVDDPQEEVMQSLVSEIQQIVAEQALWARCAA
jgi:hypothetical protein